MRWCFKMQVSEGPRGYADRGDFQSEWYSSFERCYRDYVNFRPRSYWPHLRHVLWEQVVYDSGTRTFNNPAHDTIIEYDNCELELGITEAEFDRIIEAIESS